MNIEILRMTRARVPLMRSEIVAFFEARVGDFRLRKCSVREQYATGQLYVALPGREDSGIGFSDGETKDRLREMALADYKAMHHE